MRVLTLHNFYCQPGGEDRVFGAEAALLEARGHDVIRYARHNNELAGKGALAALSSAVWNREVVCDLRRLIADRKPDVAHVHNVFSVLSPAVYSALWEAGVPVVQTVHNYRLVCPSARLRRRGLSCSECRGRLVPWPAMIWRCYQDRLASSIAMGTVLGVHNIMRTWWKWIDLYVFPSEYARRQLFPAHFPADRTVVKPHFVEDPGSVSSGSGGALFLGRLEAEKGVLELIEAWRHVRGCTLEIIGDGPLMSTIQSCLKDRDLSHVSLAGWLSRDEVSARLSSARLVTVPSLGDESFGLPIIEAFSHGVPVLASSRGALPELVQENVNGFLADPLDAHSLAQKVVAVIESPSQWRRLSEGARQSYALFYGVESACRNLMCVYEQAINIHAEESRRRQ